MNINGSPEVVLVGSWANTARSGSRKWWVLGLIWHEVALGSHGLLVRDFFYIFWRWVSFEVSLSVYKNECDPHFLPLQFLFPLFNLKYLSFEPELITEWNVLICIIFSFFSTECEVTMLLQLSTQSKK
jgi:hypothetical protein